MSAPASTSQQQPHPQQPQTKPPAGAGGRVTPERIMQMAWGHAAPLMIEAAVHLGVFDALDGGPLLLEQVASRTNASPRGIRALLNGLVGLQLLTKDSGGRYALTPESAAFLVSTKPDFRGGLFRHVSKQLMPVWLDLTDVVRTGKPARQVNDAGSSAEFFQKFVEDIFPMSYAAAQALGKALNLADRPAKVLDVASGSGVWGIALAEQAPGVRVTAVDWEGVLPVTRRVAQRHGVADRFTYLAGDIHTVDWGKRYDVATLGHILHGEGRENSRKLLRRVHDALAPGGTIAIAEFVVDEDRTGPALGLIFAVNMLVNTDAGDTYSYAEMTEWLREAGFENPRTLEAPGPSPLLLASKPR
jgi:ubiquinone/menaquinone biosynthesis C-methylase UbiE